jgi:hypothetical protein
MILIRRVTFPANPSLFLKLNISANITDSESQALLITNTHNNVKKYQKLNEFIIKKDKIYNESKYKSWK